MLRKKLGKEPIKTTPNTATGTNTALANKPALGGVSIDKERLTQIMMEK